MGRGITLTVRRSEVGSWEIDIINERQCFNLANVLTLSSMRARFFTAGELNGLGRGAKREQGDCRPRPKSAQPLGLTNELPCCPTLT